METQLRALLYAQLEGHQVAFNPVEPEPFDLVDLTIDVTNSTRIYHPRTECVREALTGANLIVTDSQPLANTIRRALPQAMVTALPFGAVSVAREMNEKPVIGLLNHTGDMEMNNVSVRKLLNSLKRPLLVYGRALAGVEPEIEENFEAFCAKCDILLLPSLPGAINSTTLPLAAMSAGIAVLAHNAPGYYDLDAATGVQLLPGDPAAWRLMLTLLESQPAKLRTMQERNRAYALRLNRASLERAGLIPAQGPTARLTPAGDCGCDKKKPAPTKPTQDQPIIKKELF